MSATNVARAGKRGNICVGNNVSSFASTLSARLCAHVPALMRALIKGVNENILNKTFGFRTTGKACEKDY